MTIEELTRPLPWGLHDAYLVRIGADWERREVSMEVRVQIGDHQQTDQLARIVVTGLEFFLALPPEPTASSLPLEADALPWIDAGPGRMPHHQALALPPTPEGCFLHHLLIRESWQAFYLCGRDARLEWLEPEPRASQSGRRVLFPDETLEP